MNKDQKRAEKKMHKKMRYVRTFFSIILSGSTPPRDPVPTNTILNSWMLFIFPLRSWWSDIGNGTFLKTRTGLGWNVIGAKMLATLKRSDWRKNENRNRNKKNVNEFDCKKWLWCTIQKMRSHSYLIIFSPARIFRTYAYHNLNLPHWK